MPSPYVSQPVWRAEVEFMTMATNGGEQPQAQQNAPQLNVLAQYIKDFSFENPNAPRSLASNPAQPAINIQINVGVGQLSATDYEVSLKLEGKAESADAATLLFAFDLTYAGVFRIQNVPQEQVHPVVMIECPRLLFPFAREIIATSVRAGGFPPLLLDPVDFVALYQQRMAQMQQQPATAAT
jgi:preprotein translocase subunit SecB